MEKITACIYDVKDFEYKKALLSGLGKIDFRNIIKSDSKVLIKPNFTWTSHKKGVTTTPNLLKDLTKILKNHVSELYIGESDGANNSWSAEQAFKGHGLFNMAKENGFELINLSKHPSIKRTTIVNGKKITLSVSKFILEKIDTIITVPVLKIHASTIVSLGLKNQWGCLPDPMRLLYHPFLHEGIVAVNKIYNPQISIIDATYGLNRTGPIFGTPIKLNKIMISNNITALDILACAFMGIPYNKIKHINIAKDEFIKNFKLNDVIKCGDFKTKFEFNLNKTFYDTFSNFVMFHEKLNNFFYDSVFSNYIQTVLQLYKILLKRESSY